MTKPDSTVIDRFVEKPVEFVGNRINAGIYMFNPSILERIEVSTIDGVECALHTGNFEQRPSRSPWSGQ